MKLVGIAGTVEDKSYNKILLQFIANNFSNLADIEILSIDDIPMFDQDNDQTESGAIQYLNRKISGADGVIIATPEHNHTITAALKSVIEWLSFKVHPFSNKPVMIVGASYYEQGSSRAQLNLRQILEAPGVNAIVFPGNEFLLANVKEAFDDNGRLKDEKTTAFLQTTLQKFLRFVKVINTMNQATGGHDDAAGSEDLNSKGKISTTIEGVDMAADDWVEKAAEKVNAVEGNTYVKLDRGILTVDQLNYFLNSMPIELTYADSNNQFIYYNKMTSTKKMLAPRRPGQVGDPLSLVHPKRAIQGVKSVIHALRTGKTDMVKMPVPGNGPDKYIMHFYKAMHDEKGEYVGINEFVLDIMPIIKWYLNKTGQKLAADPNAKVDANTGASSKDDEAADNSATDADTSASTHDEPEASTGDTDATTGASES
ncbi:NAD(P)H-dependent oxidoreductase [Lentilactobacillus hilgardii]|uniref:NAD(P)H-dependent oxidoreductase n=1 Tax=Lentilactobacillus hilgardii TaxID=1588 RepID=A0A6P1EAB9_LENHI|nr:NAD(P)H-dependent oxidoreductase [Lentilactobacillus hilgardii]EEI71327.1 flavin reductase [Lentilactobacillus hilgardii ATCC 27305]MCT3393161.1 NAD(P)H-dependent oxidoreductase [Lentilactobacillus hilgardii]QHB52545.1 NAD(P)H-dependent oxidoreductase [Lentilactobacillus hilgardii]RRG08552.1 MAG: NAD(P)H-dependent oxidoreductase [Lactobacillus sp.]